MWKSGSSVTMWFVTGKLASVECVTIRTVGVHVPLTGDPGIGVEVSPASQ